MKNVIKTSQRDLPAIYLYPLYVMRTYANILPTKEKVKENRKNKSLEYIYIFLEEIERTYCQKSE